jgi:hypothetical protein
MSCAQDDAWAAVLGPLYTAVQAARPGSFEERVAERAIDYAINSFAAGEHECVPAAFAVHDHLRNARHNVARAEQREVLGFRKLAAVSTGSGATRVLGPIEYRSPEDHVVATDFLQRLRGKVSADPRAAAVLDGMLRELPPPLISSDSKIPLRTVERLRASIRVTATEMVA